MKEKFSLEEAAELKEIGKHLRAAREKCGCTQDEYAKIFSVTPNTLAQWERGALKASGANRRKIRNIQVVIKNPRVLGVIHNIKNRDDGMAAVAGLLAMLLGLIEYSGLGFGAVEHYVKPESTLINAVKQLANEIYDDTFNRFQNDKK